MSRTQTASLIAGTVVTAAAAGVAFGALFAPASGKELRRRLAWLGEHQWKTFSRSAERYLHDLTARAAAEIARAKACSPVKAH